MIRASYDLTIGNVTQRWEIEVASQTALVSSVVDALRRLVNETSDVDLPDPPPPEEK